MFIKISIFNPELTILDSKASFKDRICIYDIFKHKEVFIMQNISNIMSSGCIVW